MGFIMDTQAVKKTQQATLLPHFLKLTKAGVGMRVMELTTKVLTDICHLYFAITYMFMNSNTP